MAALAASASHPGIEVGGKKSSSPDGGRSLRATKAFNPGEQIALFASPLVAIPAGPAAKTVCNYCLAAGRPVKACTACRAVAYCGAACQKSHWTLVHKQECKAFKRVHKAVGQDWLPTPVRALVQILLRWGDDGVRDVVEALQGNVEAFRTNKIWKDLEMQALAGCTYAGWETTDENLKLAAEILCKIQTNSFDRSDPDTGQSGTFLDPTLAMANHSCIPNAIVAFTKRKAYLRAESPIGQGDEITISYIDYTKPKVFRQHGLELYHFTCTCRRCKDDLDVYQVCRKSPLLSLNAFSFVPDTRQLLVPPVDLDLSQNKAFRAQVEKLYAACAPEARVPPEQRLASLRMQWQLCEPLVRAKMWAVEPLAQIFQKAISYYTEQQNYLHALVIECFVATSSDPYKYVAPFAQWRLKGLLMIAKTLTNTAMPSEQGFKGVHPGIVPVLEKTDEGSLYQAIVLMVCRYAPMAHSEEWEILAEAKEMLRDVESLDSRKEESKILHEWVKDPSNPAAGRFFRERALEPVEALAALAVDVLKADLEPQSLVSRA